MMINLKPKTHNSVVSVTLRRTIVDDTELYFDRLSGSQVNCVLSVDCISALI